MESKSFVNFSNHPSEKWCDAQRKAAEEYGNIVDIAFPSVNPTLNKDGVRELAEQYTSIIVMHKPAAVLCQGEFTLCFAVINMLKEKSVPVFAACSKRIVEETAKGKISIFEFEQFREY